MIDHNGIGERSGVYSPGPLQRGPHGGRGVSPEFLERLDLDAHDLLEEAMERAEEVIGTIGRERLLELAELLVERDTFLRAEIVELLLPELESSPNVSIVAVR